MGKAKRLRLAVLRALQGRREQRLVMQHTPESTWEARAMRGKA